MKAAFLFLFISAISVAQASRIELRVAERSTVRVGDPIRLGALLSRPIDDSELDAKIYDLVISEPMNSEGERQIQSEELALTLRRKLSFQDLQRLSLKIPETFTLKAKRNFIYRGDIIREIKEQAKVLCSQCEIEFDDLKIPEIRASEELLQVRLDPQGLKGAGSFLLPLQIETSKTRNVFWVTGKVSFYKEAPVVKRLIRSNDRIAERDFEIKRVNVSFAKDGFPELKEIAGKLASRTLAVGQPIFSSDLRPEPAATRGQAVKILVGSDGFEVMSSGIAEESGSVGDLIKIKNQESNKILSGVLVDKGTVRIQ